MRKELLNIGITGGIGSGKSTVCRVFERLGYRIYSADDRAKHLMIANQELIDQIKNLLGSQAYFPDGKLNRKWIGAQVFSDKEKLQSLNQLVHPAVRRDFETWRVPQSPSYGKSFLLYEAAILFESGGKDRVDAVISVYAPKETRIQRVMKRDGATRAQVEARMANQWPDKQKLALADWAIYNDGTHMLIPQVMAAMQHFEERTPNPLEGVKGQGKGER